MRRPDGLVTSPTVCCPPPIIFFTSVRPETPLFLCICRSRISLVEMTALILFLFKTLKVTAPSANESNPFLPDFIDWKDPSSIAEILLNRSLLTFPKAEGMKNGRYFAV